MNLTPRRAELLIAQLIVDLGTIAHRLPTAVANELDIIHGDATDDDRQRAADAGVRGRNWITDPTGERATSIVTGESRDLENILLNLQAMNGSVAYLRKFCERRAPIGTEPHRRCQADRQEHLEPWYDPTCTGQALGRRTADGGWSWDTHGLCSACYQRRRRWRQGEQDQAS